MKKIEELREFGFEPITTWTLNKNRIALRELSWSEASGWLYAFVVDDELKYVGITGGVLRSRMDNYRDLKHSQTTRLREEINSALVAGHTVEIFGRKEPDPLACARDEKMLIAKLQPTWNRT